MGGQSVRPCEAEVGGHVSPRWEAEVGGRSRRPHEAEVGGHGSLIWEAA